MGGYMHQDVGDFVWKNVSVENVKRKEMEWKIKYYDNMAEKMKLTPIQAMEVWQLALDMKIANPTFRKGQVLFNALFKLYPLIADEVRATENDPFYDDTIIPAFKKRVLHEPF